MYIFVAGLTLNQRTGNYKVHRLTKKRPVEVYALEKQHLQPVFPLLSKENIHDTSITRVVAKDNTIYYKSNRYTLSIGSYKPNRDNSDVCKHLARVKTEKIDPVTRAKIANKYRQIKVTTRSLDSYAEILGGAFQ